MNVEQESHQILQYHRQSRICGKIRFYRGSMNRYATMSLPENLETRSLFTENLCSVCLLEQAERVQLQVSHNMQMH